MSTRASNARHVRQRKLNTKQPLRIIREDQVEETGDEQQQIAQVETGVEKGEEVVRLSLTKPAFQYIHSVLLADPVTRNTICKPPSMPPVP